MLAEDGISRRCIICPGFRNWPTCDWGEVYGTKSHKRCSHISDDLTTMVVPGYTGWYFFLLQVMWHEVLWKRQSDTLIWSSTHKCGEMFEKGTHRYWYGEESEAFKSVWRQIAASITLIILGVATDIDLKLVNTLNPTRCRELQEKHAEIPLYKIILCSSKCHYLFRTEISNLKFKNLL